MPRKSKKSYIKRRPYRRRYRKRYRRNRGLATLPSTTGIPDRLRVKLAYIGTYNLQSNLGVTIPQIFRGNGAYDPDYTGAGGQPTGYDQWSAFYAKYRVIASSVSVKFVSQSSTAVSYSSICYVVPSKQIYSPGSITAKELITNKYARYRINASSSGSDAVSNVRHYISTKKITGTPEDKDEHYTAAVTTTPAEEWYWSVGVVPLNYAVSSTDVSVHALVTVNYYIEFFDRKLINDS